MIHIRVAALRKSRMKRACGFRKVMNQNTARNNRDRQLIGCYIITSNSEDRVVAHLLISCCQVLSSPWQLFPIGMHVHDPICFLPAAWTADPHSAILPQRNQPLQSSYLQSIDSLYKPKLRCAELRNIHRCILAASHRRCALSRTCKRVAHLQVKASSAGHPSCLCCRPLSSV